MPSSEPNGFQILSLVLLVTRFSSKHLVGGSHVLSNRNHQGVIAHLRIAYAAGLVILGSVVFIAYLCESNAIGKISDQTQAATLCRKQAIECEQIARLSIELRFAIDRRQELAEFLLRLDLSKAIEVLAPTTGQIPSNLHLPQLQGVDAELNLLQAKQKQLDDLLRDFAFARGVLSL